MQFSFKALKKRSDEEKEEMTEEETIKEEIIKEERSEEEMIEEIIKVEKKFLKFFNQKKKAKEPIQYRNEIPLLPRFYLYFPKPEIIGIERLMLALQKDFNEYLRMVPSDYKEELKCMKEEYYLIHHSKRKSLIIAFIQRNEELRRELGM